MTTLPRLLLTALLAVPGAAFAEDAHHPDQAGALPAQCAAMMPMMQQMMQMMTTQQGGAMPAMPMGAASDATRAYMEVMRAMDAPMMQALQVGDPDVAFVTAMIPHHQGAIDMAEAVLRYGKDPTVKQWADQIIAAQEAEIAAMQAWLKQRGQ
jgi:uncharacterized protein (DUF305 family)